MLDTNLTSPVPVVVNVICPSTAAVSVIEAASKVAAPVALISNTPELISVSAVPEVIVTILSLDVKLT